MADEPPYLTLGTEVSAKFKGAFCEAKIKKVSKSVKCKVTFTNSTNNSSYQIPDDDIQGNNLQIGAMVKAKHPQLNGQLFEAKIVKIIDSSAYTVEFDDGDVRVLKRNLICLKGQKHFQESQTLDKLPLTNPELFGTPVVTKKLTSNMSNSSSLSSSNNKTNSKNREKSKMDSMLKDNKEYRKSQSLSKNITPSSTADKKIKRDKRHTTAITTKLPERHKDGSHHRVRVKSVLDVDKESDSQKDHHKTFSKEKENVAVKNVAKDKDASRERKDTASERQGTLENLEENSEDEDEEEEESLEEKDHFVAQLYKFMEDRGTPLNKLPTIGTTDLNFHKLYKVVSALGYYNKVTNNEKWNEVCQKMGVFKQCDWPKSLVVKRVQAFYKKYLLRFEEFSRKLGCTLMTLPISSVNTSTFKSNSSSGGSASSVSLAANLESHHASERDKTVVTSGNGVNSGHYRNSLNLNVIMSATDNSNASHNIQGRSLIREKRFGKVLDKNNKSPTIPPSKSLGSDLPAKTSDRGTFKSGYKDSGGGKMRTSSSSSNSLSSISSTDNIPSTSGSLANQEDAAAFTPTTKDPKVNTYKANDDTAEREGGKAELSDQFKYSASYLYLKRKKSLQKLSLKSSNNVNVTRDNIKDDSNTKLHEENFKVDSRKTDHSKMNEVDSDRAVRRDKKAKLRDGDSSNQFDDARHSGVNTASLKRTAKDITADDKVEPRLLSSDQENEAKMVDQHRAHKKKVVKHSLPATDSKETILAKSEVLNPAIGGSHPKTVKAVDEKSINISQRSVYDFTDIADFTVGDFCRKQESYTENIVDEKNPEFATRSAPIMGPYLNTPLIDINASVFSLPDIGATRSGLDFEIKAPSSHDEFEGPQQKFDDSFSVPNEVDKSGPQDYLPLIADSIKFETEIGDDVVISSNDSQIRDSFVDKDKILESEETNTGNGNGNTRSSRRLEARKRQTTILKLGPENLYSISEITKVIPCSNENKEPAISNPINEEGFGALPAKDSEIKTSDAERNPPTLIVDQNAPPAEDKIAEESYPISEIKMADEENKDHELANENAVSVTRPEKLNDDEQQALKESLNLSSTISSKLFDDMLKKEEDGSIADDERENNKSLINNDDAGNIFKSFGGNMGVDLMNSTFASEKDEINESKDKITTPSSQRKKSQTIFALPPEIQTNFVCTYDFLALDSNLLLNAKISATKTNINTLRKVYQKHKSKVSEIDKILKNIQKMEENGSSSTDIKEYYNNIKENISLASVSSDSSSPE
ncbi:AT-rich interactive domain-containing protein 4B-like isoform X3 [Gordionus sp. m RMFG-2023]|uniref:AT-rich interactive domain-containing protein 4B-like isoform X3 n=1 Tax=Gordionus sp. m RMFG-2023 TaxID=3053472 RepID=UPI0031FD71F7